MQNRLTIDISEEIQDFHYHLLENNNVVLSAQFGDGKSYMLNEFKEKYEGSYLFITLYPVNYTIAENGDILEYIKRDIIFQLLREGLITDTTDFSAVTNSLFTAENIKEVINDIAKSKDNSSLIGTALKVIVNAKEKYDSDKKTTENLMYYYKTQKGGLYEDDILTMIIRAGLRYANKPSVLIVEDLDRVDPAHLFRLLNVLSTQFDRPYVNDNSSNSNKFGFDKTILVLDYEQTSNLYTHFYGSNVGYQGYMSKIMSSRPYIFNITHKAQDTLLNHIKNEVHSDSSCFCISMMEDIINNLSVREVASILNADISHFVKNNKFTTSNGTNIDSACGATNLLFYMYKLGMSLSEFYSGMFCEVKDTKIGKGFIELLAPYILKNEDSDNVEIRLFEKDTKQTNTYTLTVDSDSSLRIEGITNLTYHKPNYNDIIKKALDSLVQNTNCKGMYKEYDLKTGERK